MKPGADMLVYQARVAWGQAHPGAASGPAALLAADLLPTIASAAGRGVHVQQVALPADVPLDARIREYTDGYRIFNLSVLTQSCHNIYHNLKSAVSDGRHVLTLGGDHSVSIGTIAAALYAVAPVGVLWIDAHSDFNTPASSPSGNIHGMVIRTLFGEGPAMLPSGTRRLLPAQIMMVGIRDVDPEEDIALRASGIRVIRMSEIVQRGLAWLLAEITVFLSGFASVHVSFDVDVLDPAVAPGVSVPVVDGFALGDVLQIAACVAASGRMCSADIVEVNPVLDVQQRTAKAAVQVAGALFSKRI